MQAQHMQQMTTILGEALVVNTMHKLAQIEAAKCLRRMTRLQAELGQYETHFALTSEDAWQQYQAGALGDDFEVMEWMALFENFRALQEYYGRLNSLQLS